MSIEQEQLNSQTAAGGNDSNFAVKDCALLVLATGKKVRWLQEFRNCLATIDTASLYHHFWGGLLQARFEEREYNNDFAAWVRHEAHDPVLAERLAVLDPTAFADLNALRREILELLDTRLEEEDEQLAATRVRHPFVFVRSQIVVFDTKRVLRHPTELGAIIEDLSIGSIFYHFIDARRRTDDGRDDFSEWLELRGDAYLPLRNQLADIDPYFGSLINLRQRLALLFHNHFNEQAS